MSKKRTRMFRAYFNDEQCSAPYMAKNDEMALEVGKARAEFHAEYNKLPADEITITAIDEIEMFKQEKGSKWYIKTPLTMLRAVDLKELKGYSKIFFDNMPSSAIYDALFNKNQNQKWNYDYWHFLDEIKAHYDDKPVQIEAAKDYFYYREIAPIMLGTLDFVNKHVRGQNICRAMKSHL